MNRAVLSVERTPDAVWGFSGEYYFLSNYYAHEIVAGGIAYPTNEHAFAAYKCTDREMRADIAALSTPGMAKAAGRGRVLIPTRANPAKKRRISFRGKAEWDAISGEVMRRLARTKFRDAALRRLLLATGARMLVEANTWGDRHWGVDARTGEGENHLGRILMDIRDEVRAEVREEARRALNGVA